MLGAVLANRNIKAETSAVIASKHSYVLHLLVFVLGTTLATHLEDLAVGKGDAGSVNLGAVLLAAVPAELERACQGADFHRRANRRWVQKGRDVASEDTGRDRQERFLAELLAHRHQLLGEASGDPTLAGRR